METPQRVAAAVDSSSTYAFLVGGAAAARRQQQQQQGDRETTAATARRQQQQQQGDSNNSSSNSLLLLQFGVLLQYDKAPEAKETEETERGVKKGIIRREAAVYRQLLWGVYNTILNYIEGYS